MWPLGQSFGSDSFSFFSLHCRERKERAFLVPNVRSCWQKLKWRTTSGYEYEFVLVPHTTTKWQKLTLKRYRARNTKVAPRDPPSKCRLCGSRAAVFRRSQRAENCTSAQSHSIEVADLRESYKSTPGAIVPRRAPDTM